MAISEGEYMELAQASPAIVKDGRTGGLAKMWVWDGLSRRWVRDDAEAVEIQNRFGLPTTYPTNPLPVVSWPILQRSVLVGDSPP